MKIIAIRYLKQAGEYVITTKDEATGKTSKTYANNLTSDEKAWVEASEHSFEDSMSVCWVN